MNDTIAGAVNSKPQLRPLRQNGGKARWSAIAADFAIHQIRAHQEKREPNGGDSAFGDQPKRLTVPQRQTKARQGIAPHSVISG